MSQILKAALQYAKRGWHVVPLKGKAPRIADWPNTASTDPHVIEDWWRDFPDSNVGIATGNKSGIFVLDVDGDTGELSLLDLETAYGKLPKTYEVSTGRGRHLYFSHPIGITINNFTGLTGPASALDVKADKGQVVAPPSIHPERLTEYKKVDNGQDLAVIAPGWLLGLLIDKPGESRRRKQFGEFPNIELGTIDNTLAREAGYFRRRGYNEDTIKDLLSMVDKNYCTKVHAKDSDFARIAKSIAQKEPGKFSESGELEEGELLEMIGSEVKMIPTLWRWPGYIPKKKIFLWVGDPSQGKSVMSCMIAAYITTGKKFPGDDSLEEYPPQNVIILSAEDDIDDTIIPRVKVAGGDLSKIICIKPMLSNGKPLSLPIHTLKLAALINQTKAGLVIIDPLNAFLGAEVDSYKNADVRRSMVPIESLASNSGASILVISHFNKSSTMSAMQRVSGSAAFVEGPRVSYSFGSSKEFPGHHIFAPLKVNIRKKETSLRYSLEDAFIEGVGMLPVIKWQGTSEETADSTLAPDLEPKGALDEAKEFLRENLATGPKATKDIQHLADQLDISEATLRRAKKEMKIEVRQKGNKFYLALPKYEWGKTDELFKEEKDKGEI